MKETIKGIMLTILGILAGLISGLTYVDGNIGGAIFYGLVALVLLGFAVKAFRTTNTVVIQSADDEEDDDAYDDLPEEEVDVAETSAEEVAAETEATTETVDETTEEEFTDDELDEEKKAP